MSGDIFVGACLGMGACNAVVARFPDGAVNISNFAEPGQPTVA